MPMLRREHRRRARTARARRRSPQRRFPVARARGEHAQVAERHADPAPVAELATVVSASSSRSRPSSCSPERRGQVAQPVKDEGGPRRVAHAPELLQALAEQRVARGGAAEALARRRRALPARSRCRWPRRPGGTPARSLPAASAARPPGPSGVTNRPFVCTGKNASAPSGDSARSRARQSRKAASAARTPPARARGPRPSAARPPRPHRCPARRPAHGSPPYRRVGAVVVAGLVLVDPPARRARAQRPAGRRAGGRSRRARRRACRSAPCGRGGRQAHFARSASARARVGPGAAARAPRRASRRPRRSDPPDIQIGATLVASARARSGSSAQRGCERRAQVVVLALQGSGASSRRSAQRGLRASGTSQVARRRAPLPRRPPEPLARVLAHRLEQPVAGRAPQSSADDERLVDQPPEHVERRRGPAAPSPARHALGRLQRERPGEHGEPAEERCSLAVSRSWLQSIVARSVCWRGSAARGRR